MLQKVEPRAIFTHCYGHSLNLACMDAIKRCSLLRNCLDVVQEITNLIKKSPRRDALLQRLKEEINVQSPGIRVLCPTRWTVRADCLDSILRNYSVLFQLWEESLDIVKEAEMRGRIIGVSTYMKSFDFYFGVVLGEMLLRHSDNLSKSLQTSQMSAAEGQQVASLTVRTLASLRGDDQFDLFWTKVTTSADAAGVDEPVLPRSRKVPRRFEVGDGAGYVVPDVKTKYCHVYFEAVDLLVNSIQSRFDQPGYQVYSQLEELLVKSAKGEDVKEVLTQVCTRYGEDFEQKNLQVQLTILHQSVPTACTSLQDILKHIVSLSSAQRSLMSEVCTLVRLLLVMPATNAQSERSFSGLRRIKTYLRSTMGQERLNSLMLLNAHIDYTDQLDLVAIGNAFVQGSEHRQTVFGQFIPSDMQ